MSYFDYKGHLCYYEEFGSGNPLILLHGNTASSKMFLDFVSEYSNDYKVILIDFLGHGQSDRIDKFAVDLWNDEAKQVIEFIKQKNYKKVYLIGSSGGAIVAINIALEAPELVDKVIADSFEGEVPLKEFTKNAINDREASKQDEESRAFYEYMHGEGWEKVVDNDTAAIVEHDKTIGKFFHIPLSNLKAKILMTGSKEDEFLSMVSKDFYVDTYEKMIKQIGHGKYFIFEKGGHPAMSTNKDEFVEMSKKFFNEVV